MVDNAPVKTLSFKGLTIEGYSRSSADLLADSRIEVGLRFGIAAVVVYGDRHVVRFALPFRPHCSPAGVRSPAAADEDGTADDLRAGVFD